MNKSIGLLLAALFFGVTANAQISYGLKAGVNFATLSSPTQESADFQTQNLLFHVTAFGDIPIANQWSVQPGLSLQGKGDKYRMEVNGGEGDLMINLMSIEIPVNLVYYVPAGPGDIFIGAGPYAGLIFSARAKATGDAYITTPGSDLQLKSKTITLSGDEKEMNRFDAGANFLLGYKLDNGLLFNAGYGLGITKLNTSIGHHNSNRVFNIGVGYQF